MKLNSTQIGSEFTLRFSEDREVPKERIRKNVSERRKEKLTQYYNNKFEVHEENLRTLVEPYFRRSDEPVHGQLLLNQVKE